MSKRILLIGAILGSISSAHAVVFMSLTPNFKTGEIGTINLHRMDQRGRLIEGVPVNLLPHGYRPEDLVLESLDFLISDEF